MADQTTSRKLRATANKLRDASEQRDALIVRRRAEGASLFTIADECGLSHVGVKKVLQRCGNYESLRG